MSETGVVKFECEHVAREVAAFAGFSELNACRGKLLQLRMVGVGAGGIGFGNVSVRDGASAAFYITGSGTGGIAQLQLADIARVTGYDFSRNWVRCEGARTASSESLTHAAVYECARHAQVVLHGHTDRLWHQLLDAVPTTSAAIEYGTPEMALEVQRLFRETDVAERQIFVMGGHPEGIIAFGETFDAALALLMNRGAA